jgi:hypothetical protein
MLKDKNREKLILAPNFIFLYGQIKVSFLLKQLCEHVGYGDVDETFCFEFFRYFQVCLTCIF